MSPQLQINQGPQDALLYDNTRSYFTNVGYVRTSNFQVEYKENEPQNSAQFGSTVQFVIPKAADLMGPVDLRVTIPEVSSSTSFVTAPTQDATVQKAAGLAWVDELGFAMIEKATFSIGSNDIETLTGEQMQIRNELMTSDEMRLGFDHVLKTGLPVVSGADIDDNELPGRGTTSATKLIAKDYTRWFSYQDGSTASSECQPKKLIVPLGFFFTKHVYSTSHSQLSPAATTCASR